MAVFTSLAVPYPDLEIKGGGGVGVGAVSPKNFSALRASVWSKNKGGGPPLDLPLIGVE